LAPSAYCVDKGFVEREGIVYPYVIRRFDNSVVVEVAGLAKADPTYLVRSGP